MTDLNKAEPAQAGTPKPLLDIRDLQVAFRSQGRDVTAVQGASLTVYPGQTVAIVGESGSGKSTTAAAVLGLLPGNGRVTGGEIWFDGQDLATASSRPNREFLRYFVSLRHADRWAHALLNG